MDWASTKWMAITNITPDQYGNTSIGIYSYSLMVCTYLNKNHLRHVQIQTKVIGLLDLTYLNPIVSSEVKRGGCLSYLLLVGGIMMNPTGFPTKILTLQVYAFKF